MPNLQKLADTAAAAVRQHSKTLPFSPERLPVLLTVAAVVRFVIYLFLLLSFLYSPTLQAQSALEAIDRVLASSPSTRLSGSSSSSRSAGAYNYRNAPIKNQATAGKNKGRYAVTACGSCPIIWYDHPSELPAIKARIAAANKDVRAGSLGDVYDWPWEDKLNIYINMGYLNYQQIKQQWAIHKSQHPGDKTCPEIFPKSIPYLNR